MEALDSESEDMTVGRMTFCLTSLLSKAKDRLSVTVCQANFCGWQVDKHHEREK
jgi:hypothetical protein